MVMLNKDPATLSKPGAARSKQDVDNEAKAAAPPKEE